MFVQTEAIGTSGYAANKDVVPVYWLSAPRPRIHIRIVVIVVHQKKHQSLLSDAYLVFLSNNLAPNEINILLDLGSEIPSTLHGCGVRVDVLSPKGVKLFNA